jgi:phage baseplate assembly protein V
MIEALRNRVRGMVQRCVVSLVKDSFKLQGLQVTMLDGQTPDDVEHFQQYGYTSHPHAGAEGIALAIGGSTGHTVVMNVDDRRYRVQNLQAGEVCLYTDEDAQDGGHRIHFKRGQVIEFKAGASSIVMGPTGITMTAPAIDLVEG